MFYSSSKGKKDIILLKFGHNHYKKEVYSRPGVILMSVFKFRLDLGCGAIRLANGPDQGGNTMFELFFLVTLGTNESNNN